MALPTPTDWEDGPGPPSKQNVDAAWMLLAEMRPDLPDPTIGAYDNESVDLYWPGCLVNVDAEGATYHDSLTDESGHGIPPRFKAA